MDMEAVNRQRAKWESQKRLNPNQKLNAEGNPDPNGFSSFDEAAKSLYGDSYSPPGQVHPSTVSGKPRFSPPPPSASMFVGR